MWSTTSSEIEKELSSGERVLWNGQPRGGIRLRPADAFMIPFSIMWGGFAIFWEAGVVTHGAPFFFMLWGIPFVFVGLYIMFGRFILDARTRERTFYAITSERVIIVTRLFSRSTNSLSLRTLADVTLTERADGSGTITFGPTHPFGQWSAGGAWPGAGRYAPPAFDMIDRAKEVYEVIRQAQKAAV